jgi:hypothetical protein
MEASDAVASLLEGDAARAAAFRLADYSPHRGSGIAIGSNFNHSYQAVELLQVSRLCSGNTHVVTWQPDDWLWHNPQHLVCVVNKR